LGKTSPQERGLKLLVYWEVTSCEGLKGAGSKKSLQMDYLDE